MTHGRTPARHRGGGTGVPWMGLRKPTAEPSCFFSEWCMQWGRLCMDPHYGGGGLCMDPQPLGALHRRGLKRGALEPGGITLLPHWGSPSYCIAIDGLSISSHHSGCLPPVPLSRRSVLALRSSQSQHSCPRVPVVVTPAWLSRASIASTLSTPACSALHASTCPPPHRAGPAPVGLSV